MGFVANDTVLRGTLKEAASIARRGPLWIGLAGAAVIVGLAGPFGTYTAMPFAARFAYWAFVVVTTFWIGFLTSFATATWVEARGTPAQWALGLGALAASLPVALLLSALHAAFFSEPFLGEVGRLLPYAAVISLGAAFLFEAVEARDRAVPECPENRSEPAWLDRLPPELGRDLLLLQAQDHYLRAVTPLGETLLRGSIAEADEALGDYGIRVHRSWWVARSAIRRYRYSKGTSVIVLSTGQEIPVGRRFRRQLRDSLDRKTV